MGSKCQGSRLAFFAASMQTSRRSDWRAETKEKRRGVLVRPLLITFHTATSTRFLPSEYSVCTAPKTHGTVTRTTVFEF